MTAEAPVLVARTRRLRVFLAEDDDEMRRMIAGVLRSDGHVVFEARDGSALACDLQCGLWEGSGQSMATVIISDVRMPERDGLSVLRAMRYHGGCPPFILITGFGDEDLHVEAIRLGAHAVLDKPFDLDELRRVLTAIAEQASAAR
jgi:DNA-binding response OmpR family regulator